MRDKAPFSEPISRQVLPSCRPGDMRVLCCALSLPSTPTRDTPANAVLSAVERRDNVAATRKWRSAVELVAHTSARAQQRSWVSSISTIIISSSRSCLTRFLVFPRCHERRAGWRDEPWCWPQQHRRNGDACRMTCLGTVWLFALLCVCFTKLKFNFAISR